MNVPDHVVDRLAGHARPLTDHIRAAYAAGVSAERNRWLESHGGDDLVADARMRGAMAERQRIVAAIREYAAEAMNPDTGIPAHVRLGQQMLIDSVGDLVEKLDTTGEGP